MSEFKEGDVVILKSGGPKMTLSHIIDQPSTWYCVWFEGTKEKSEAYRESVFRKFDPAVDVKRVGVFAG